MSSTLSAVYTCYYQAEKSQPSFWVLVSFSAASVKLLFFVVISGLVLLVLLSTLQLLWSKRQIYFRSKKLSQEIRNFVVISEIKSTEKSSEVQVGDNTGLCPILVTKLALCVLYWHILKSISFPDLQCHGSNAQLAKNVTLTDASIVIAVSHTVYSMFGAEAHQR